ncbi:MAG: hypothetical protein C5S45_00995 [Candidatus Methanocomedens sp.]|nr:MAG: hypothetical protein C5S45_00995 [ANME-2 cluster archaeon]
MDGVFEVNTPEESPYTGLVHCTGYTYHSTAELPIMCIL